MVMITGTHIFPAVNHAASSTLLPTLLAPHNKYAIISLRAGAGDREAGRKHPTAKLHFHTHTYVGLLHSKTHVIYLLKGTLNYPCLYS